MDRSLADLLDALPNEISDTAREKAEKSLRSLVKDLEHKPVPAGQLRRAWIFGSVQAKIAAAYMANWIRTGLSESEEKERRLSETRLKAALELLGGMGYLRGAMMKVGQLFANYPDIVPEEFASIFGYFHFEAPPMHFSLLRELVRGQLGADPEDLFDDFETEAFAAASFGQVHRARIKGSGEKVAVKIQYPGIAHTIRDDLRNMKSLLLPLRLRGDWDNLSAQYDEILGMVEKETDYEQEAENLRVARSAFGADEGILVPEVYSDLSTKRVLTMEFVEGIHLKTFLASNPSQEIRNAYGEKIWLSSVRLSSQKRMIYADPHPGNYFFRPDGVLGLVDLGCCRYLSDEEVSYCDAMERASIEPAETSRENMILAVDPRPGQKVAEDQLDLVKQFSDWCWEPIHHPGCFDFSDAHYFQRGVDIIREVVRRGYLRSRPVNNWQQRSFFGLRAMLYRLGAHIDAGSIYRMETTAAAQGLGEGDR
ncbi:MAG: AarF/ABC1/UbiB kinase family protein [Acidobacteriota bacterium]|jgi:aarF domain-containing kinase